MLAPRFDVANFETLRLHRLEGMADMVELRAREDVFQQKPFFRDDLAGAAAASLDPPGEAVIQQQTAVAQQAVQLAEIGWVIPDPDMFVHADRGDLVVFAIQALVTPEFHRHLVLQAFPAHFFHRVIMLGLRKRHAMRRNSIGPGGVAQQSAPATANIEKPITGSQAELLADDVELVPLRPLQRIVGVGEIGAGILHLGIEEEGVEVVADIVVKLNERLVVAFALAPPGRVAAIFVFRGAPGRLLEGEQQRKRAP